MPNDRVRRIVSATADFLTLASKRATQTFTVVATILVAVNCAVNCNAQNQSQAVSVTQTSSQNSVAAQPSTVTIPAGVQFALVLTDPISSKTMHRGNQINAETTAPVTVGDRVLIPSGTFLQGKIDKLTRDGSRAEILLNSATVIFPDGYVANVVGPLNIESDEGTAWRDPSSRAKVGAFIAPAAGLGIGTLIGVAAHTTRSVTLGGTTLTSSSLKGVAIGSSVGFAAGIAISLALLLNGRHFFVDVGSPMETTLPQPLTLSANRVTDSVRWAQEHPVAAPIAAPRPYPYAYGRGTCYMRGTPGTPPTIIPGTPAIGDNPGTPATVIPGTPGIPGSTYPCRW
jgi:hypothetical protein